LCQMKKNKKEVVEEYLKGGVTYQELAKKYKIHQSTVGKWIRGIIREDKVVSFATAPYVVVELQKKLHAAQLHNKLLETMLDICSEQYGIDLRKKPGAKRS
jgi:transposase-like protein